jgi:hypothetical protein
MNYRRSLLALVFLSTTTLANAAPAKSDAPVIKWNTEVGGVIKPLSVEVGIDMGGGRIVTITYQALKPCRSMAIMGYPYSNDGAQLSGFIFGQKYNVTTGQKFREQFFAASEPGSYLVLEKASCN